jgi:hypothetical protein
VLLEKLVPARADGTTWDGKKETRHLPNAIENAAVVVVPSLKMHVVHSVPYDVSALTLDVEARAKLLSLVQV